MEYNTHILPGSEMASQQVLTLLFKVRILTRDPTTKQFTYAADSPSCLDVLVQLTKGKISILDIIQLVPT